MLTQPVAGLSQHEHGQRRIVIMKEKGKVIPYIPHEIKGFTPAPDVISRKYGIVTSAVYGKIWRYCRAYGKCRASQGRMAEELGLSRRTIINKITLLIENDYIIDETPGLKNVPHIYVTTNKIVFKTVTEVYEEDGVQEIHTGVQEIHTRCALDSHEDSLLDSEGDKTMPEEFDQELIPYLTALGLSTIDPSASELRRASTMRTMRKSALERKERKSYDLPPDVHDLIAAFIDCFGREYTSGEKSYWIKIARSWLELGVTPDQVKKMYSHCAEKGMTIKSPDSLTWAWDDLRLSGEQVSKQKFANTY